MWGSQADRVSSKRMKDWGFGGRLAWSGGSGHAHVHPRAQEWAGTLSCCVQGSASCVSCVVTHSQQLQRPLVSSQWALSRSVPRK